jgi:hypothetical protein
MKKYISIPKINLSYLCGWFMLFQSHVSMAKTNTNTPFIAKKILLSKKKFVKSYTRACLNQRHILDRRACKLLPRHLRTAIASRMKF